MKSDEKKVTDSISDLHFQTRSNEIESDKIESIICFINIIIDVV